MNYYIHCKRQCYLFGQRLNLEDNSEEVKIGRAIHEDKAKKLNHEIIVENVRLDRLTSDYLTEIKKSDADEEAAKWQLIFYLKILKDKGIRRKGKLEFVKKNKKEKKETIVELDSALEDRLEKYINEIENLLEKDDVPPVLNQTKCKKCAYYEYCYI